MKLNQNPWLNTWTSPRQTISQIIEENPNRAIWRLAWIYGILSLLNASQSFLLGSQLQLTGILIFAIVIAPLWGMLIFSVWSWVVLMVGKMLKGQGNFSQVRAAFAWSCVPLLLNVAFWVLLLLIFSGSIFAAPQIQTGPMGLFYFILLGKVVVMVWSLVIYINMLSQVQQFSIARSIANILLSWVVIGVVIALIWAGLNLWMPHPLASPHAVLNLNLWTQL